MSVVTEAAWKKQREEAKTLRRENREFRERLHEQAFLIDNQNARIAELERRCDSQQERLCVAQADFELAWAEALGRQSG